MKRILLFFALLLPVISQAQISIIGHIQPNAPSDPYPTHLAEYGKGGHRTVYTLAGLDSITSLRKEEGMTVSVIETGLTYKLVGSDWIDILAPIDDTASTLRGLINTKASASDVEDSLAAIRSTYNSKTDTNSLLASKAWVESNAALLSRCLAADSTTVPASNIDCYTATQTATYDSFLSAASTPIVVGDLAAGEYKLIRNADGVYWSLVAVTIDLTNYFSKSQARDTFLAQSTVDTVIETGKNLFSIDSVVDGQYIVTSSGVLAPQENWATSNHIAVLPNTTYTLSGLVSTTSKRIRFETSAQDYISHISVSSVTTFTTPANCYYVVFTVKRDTDPPTYTSVQLEQDSKQTSYEQYYRNTYATTVNGYSIRAAKVEPEDSEETPFTVPQMYAITSGDSVFISHSYNADVDLMHLMCPYGGNSAMQPLTVKTIPVGSGYQRASYGSGTAFHGLGDDPAPIRFSNLDLLGGNHGLVQPFVVKASHGKTESDLMSKWTDGTNMWYLREINGDTLFLYSEPYAAGSYLGLRKLVSGTTLTHDSGAVNTSSVTWTASGQTQIYTLTTNHTYTVYIDGVKSERDSVYACSKVDIVESYDIIDPTTLTIQNPFSLTDGEVLCSNKITWSFSPNGACVVDYVLDMKRDNLINGFGFIQGQYFTSDGTTTKLKFYMPKVQSVSGYDLKNIADFTSAPASDITYQDAQVDSPNRPPDRLIELATDNSNVAKYGYAQGFLQFGQAKYSTWGGQNYYWRISSLRKSYPYVLYNKSTAGEIFHCVAYRVYFDPTINPNATAVYYVPYGGNYYLFMDFHQTLSKETIKLPPALYGKEIEEVENDFDNNVTLPVSEIVPSDGLPVNVANGYGFKVLKLK